MNTIRNLSGLILLIGVTVSFAREPSLAGTRDTFEHVGRPLEQMPRSLAVRFALSALPPSLRDNATVYVQNPATGYVLDHSGTNGQNCFVERTEWKWAEYRDDLYAAICYDSAGAKSQMRVRFDVAELRAKGVSPLELKTEIARRFAAGTYQPPERAGLSYMLAPLMRTYMSLDPSDKTIMTMVMPHVMYYAPNVTDADVGGLPPPPLSPYPFVFEQGPLGYLLQRLGAREAAKIVDEEIRLMKELCSYRAYLCLEKRAGVR
jgi:hypothetical protein